MNESDSEEVWSCVGAQVGGRKIHSVFRSVNHTQPATTCSPYSSKASTMKRLAYICVENYHFFVMFDPFFTKKMFLFSNWLKPWVISEVLHVFTCLVVFYCIIFLNLLPLKPIQTTTKQKDLKSLWESIFMGSECSRSGELDLLGNLQRPLAVVSHLVLREVKQEISVTAMWISLKA